MPASQTLYIKNLPEKIKKEDLKRVLYMLFTPFGPVLDVNARKTSKMRGQAHVLFRDVHAATQGMRSCQGMDFFGKPMVRGSLDCVPASLLTRLSSDDNVLEESFRHALQVDRHFCAVQPERRARVRRCDNPDRLSNGSIRLAATPSRLAVKAERGRTDA